MAERPNDCGTTAINGIDTSFRPLNCRYNDFFVHWNEETWIPFIIGL